MIRLHFFKIKLLNLLIIYYYNDKLDIFNKIGTLKLISM